MQKEKNIAFQSFLHLAREQSDQRNIYHLLYIAGLLIAKKHITFFILEE